MLANRHYGRRHIAVCRQYAPSEDEVRQKLHVTDTRKTVQGMVWLGLAWNCVACRVVSCRVVAWRGVAWRGVAWRGVAWRGVAWRGVAWRCTVWRVVWCGVVWYGMSWHGMVWYGIHIFHRQCNVICKIISIEMLTYTANVRQAPYNPNIVFPQ